MKNSLNNVVISELAPMNVDGKESKKLMIVLRTRGCSYARKYGGCSFCALIKHSNMNITAKNLKIQLESELAKYKNQKYEHLDLLTLGSFFDKEEIPQKFFKFALTKISKIQSLKSIMVESRPEFITREKLKLAHTIFKNVVLEIGIGVESSNKFTREHLLKKGFSLVEIESILKLLAKFNIKFVAYVLIKPVGLTEKEAIKDSIKTTEYIFALGKKYNVSTRVNLEPFYIPQNSKAELEYKKGKFKCVNLWSVIEIIKRINHLGNIFIGLSDEGLSENKLRPFSCEQCYSKVINALRRYNKKGKLSVFKGLNCRCRKKID